MFDLNLLESTKIGVRKGILQIGMHNEIHFITHCPPHPNIVKCYEIFEDQAARRVFLGSFPLLPQKKLTLDFLLVLEYLSGGTIKDKVCTCDHIIVGIKSCASDADIESSHNDLLLPEESTYTIDETKLKTYLMDVVNGLDHCNYRLLTFFNIENSTS